MAGPAVAAFPGWATMRMPSFGTGPVGPMSLSDDLDLRESLGTRSGQVVLRYSVTPVATDAPAPSRNPRRAPRAPTNVTANDVGPLRAFTLSTFDGTSWDRADSLELTGWDPAALLSSDPAIRGTAPDAERGTLADVQRRGRQPARAAPAGEHLPAHGRRAAAPGSTTPPATRSSAGAARSTA